MNTALLARVEALEAENCLLNKQLILKASQRTSLFNCSIKRHACVLHMDPLIKCLRQLQKEQDLELILNSLSPSLSYSLI